MTADQKTWTPKQVAERTGLHHHTVLAAIRSGDLRAHQPKVAGRELRKYLVKDEDLDDWIAHWSPT